MNMCATARLADIQTNLPPQHGLPALFAIQGLTGIIQRTGFPLTQPVSSINLILVVQIGQLFGQLVSSTIILPPFQESRERVISLVRFEPFGQLPVQAPGERPFIVGRLRRHLIVPQKGPVNLPHKGQRQLKIDTGRHTQAAPMGVLCHLKTQPLGRSIALNNDDF